MTIIQAISVNEIEEAISLAADEVHIEGGISQNIAKGIEAWHKFRQTQHRLFAATIAAIISLGFGPVGWVFGGAATIAILLLMQQKKEAERAYRAVPHALLGKDIAINKYFVYSNDGNNIVLMKE